MSDLDRARSDQDGNEDLRRLLKRFNRLGRDVTELLMRSAAREPTEKLSVSGSQEPARTTSPGLVNYNATPTGSSPRIGPAGRRQRPIS